MNTDKRRLKIPVLSALIRVNLWLNALMVTLVSPAFGQSQFAGNTPQPKPAFAGQTKAPAPAKASPAINVETITARLNSPWSLAFLPDRNFLVTESNGF